MRETMVPFRSITADCSTNNVTMKFDILLGVLGVPVVGFSIHRHRYLGMHGKTAVVRCTMLHASSRAECSIWLFALNNLEER